MRVGDLVIDTRHSPGYTPRLGLVVAVVGLPAAQGQSKSVCRVRYPGSMPMWAPIEALEVVSEGG